MGTNSLVRFTRSCPTCGRRIQIRGSLLGQVVACRHCNAEFVAMASDESLGSVDDGQRLMDRVDSVLSRSRPPVLGKQPSQKANTSPTHLTGCDK